MVTLFAVEDVRLSLQDISNLTLDESVENRYECVSGSSAIENEWVELSTGRKKLSPGCSATFVSAPES